MKMAELSARRSQGFTLVELLVAFTLLAMMFGVLYGGMNLSAKTATATSRVAVAGQTQAASRNLLRHSLENALSFSRGNNIDGERLVSFAGEALWFRYVSHIVSPRGNPAPFVFEVSFDPRRDLVELKYGAADPILASWHSPLADSLVIATDVQRFSIEYFDDSVSAGNGWQNEWRSRTHMPGLVRLDFQSSSEHWPELLIKPKNHMDARDTDEAG